MIASYTNSSGSNFSLQESSTNIYDSKLHWLSQLVPAAIHSCNAVQ